MVSSAATPGCIMDPGGIIIGPNPYPNHESLGKSLDLSEPKFAHL